MLNTLNNILMLKGLDIKLKIRNIKVKWQKYKYIVWVN